MIENIHISKHKSLTDFHLEGLGKLSVIYGDNGSGKTSICEMLKYAVDIQPKEGEEDVPVTVDSTGNWPPQILFFDTAFVAKNVHTHGKRANSKADGGHQQNSGQLIISLDEKAINLENELEDRRYALEAYREENAEILQKPSELAVSLFKKYRETDAEERKKILNGIDKETVKLNKELRKLQRTSGSDDRERKNIAEVLRNQYPEQINLTVPFAPTASQLEVWDRKGEIHELEEGICPVCGSDFDDKGVSEDKLKEVIRILHEDPEEKKFAEGVQETIDAICDAPNLLLAGAVDRFNKLEIINQHMQDEKFYNVEDKNRIMRSIEELKERVVSAPSMEGLEKSLKKFRKDFFSLSNAVNAILIRRQDAIRKFKKSLYDEDADDSAADRVQYIQETFEENAEIEAFLVNNFEEMMVRETFLEKEEELKKDAKKVEKRLKEYLSTTIPERVIGSMNEVFDAFEAPFRLTQSQARGGTKNYSFAFSILGEETEATREIEEGLSSGERQLVSLAFFFTMASMLDDKENAVIVLDDPMLDFDDSNTEYLAKYLEKKRNEFGQILVFTHNNLLHLSTETDYKKTIMGDMF